VCMTPTTCVGGWELGFNLVNHPIKLQSVSQAAISLVQWWENGFLEIRPQLGLKMSLRGDRLYRLQPGDRRGVLYSVSSIVRNISGIKFKKYENSRYILNRNTVNKLTRWLSTN